MRNKQFLFSSFCFCFFILNCAWAQEISLSLREEKGEVFLREKNLTDKKVFVPQFSFRRVPQLDVVIYEDGTPVYISGWNNPPISEMCAEKDDWDTYVRPNADSESLMGFVELPWRFNLAKDGRYFVSCFLKKGKALTAGFWSSNILSLQVKNKKIVKSEEITRDGLPQEVLQTLENELAKEK